MWEHLIIIEIHGQGPYWWCYTWRHQRVLITNFMWKWVLLCTTHSTGCTKKRDEGRYTYIIIYKGILLYLKILFSVIGTTQPLSFFWRTAWNRNLKQKISPRFFFFITKIFGTSVGRLPLKAFSGYKSLIRILGMNSWVSELSSSG